MSNEHSGITVEQLKRAIAVREQIDALTAELDSILGHSSASNTTSATTKRTMTAAGRAAISAAQKARWAKRKGGKAPTKRRRKMAAAAKAKISAAAKARWKAAKAAGKTRL